MSLKNFVKNLQTVTCPKGTTAYEIAKIMKAKGIGTIVVQERDVPVGIITDRDLVVRCLAKGGDCSDMPADQLMTHPIHTINQEASLLDLIEQFSAHKVRRLCVVNSSGNAVGLVSMADIFELLAHEMGELSKAVGERHQKLFRRTNKVRGAA